MENQDISHLNNSNLTVKSKPKLLVSIECKDDDYQKRSHTNNDDQINDLIHFDLYNKGDFKFVKHLITKNIYDSNNGQHLNSIIDLGNELETISMKDIEDYHMIIMSITDINNRPKQPNVTLYFNKRNSENSDYYSTSRQQHHSQNSISSTDYRNHPNTIDSSRSLIF